MANRTTLVGKFVIARRAALDARIAKLSADPRLQFYTAMLSTDDYEAYEAAVGDIAVEIPGLAMSPITGRDEILYARRRGWIKDIG